MIKLFVVLLFLTGCGVTNESLYDQVQKECPAICYNKNEKWTGLVKTEPESVKCICKAANSCLLTE